MDYTLTSDTVLLTRWQQARDAEAFRALVERHGDLVYGAARRVLRDGVDAEDVAQECFLILARSRQLPQRHLGGWLHTVAVNRAKNAVRGAARRRAREEAYQGEQPDPLDVSIDDTLAHVDDAIAQLDEELRHVIVAHFLEGKSQGEIAADTGVSRQTVNARVKRGVEVIRAALRKRGVVTTAAGLGTLLATQMAEAAPATLVASLGKVALSGGLAPGAAGMATSVLKLLSAKPIIGAAAAVAIVGTMLVVWGGWPSMGTTVAGHEPIAPTIATETDVPVAGEATESATPDSDVALAVVQAGDGPQGGVIRGTLVDRMDAPMQGVTIVAEGEGGEHSTEVEADGAFQMEEVPPGAYTLSARKMGYNIDALGNESIEFVSVSANVDVSNSRASEVAMQCDCESAVVSGRLVDEQGNGVADVPLRLESAPGGREDLSVGIHKLETRTDAHGNFEFHVYGPAHFWMYARDGDWSIDGPVTVHTGEVGLRIPVKSKGRGLFRMRVVDGSTGEPVERYRYEFRGREGRLHSGTAEDQEGRASTRISIQDYERVVVRVPEIGAVEHVLQVSDLGGPEKVLHLQPYLAITGVVRNRRGEPVPGARIQSIEPRFDLSSREPLTHTDGEGQFSIPNPVPSMATLYAVDAHHPHVEFDATRGRNLEVVLPEASRINGSVMASGAPLSNLKVQASRSLNHRQHRLVKREAKTNAEGHYDFAGLPGGTYGVEVTLPDADGTIYLGERSRRVTVLEGEALKSDFTFEARTATAVLTGAILEDGKPVPGRVQLVTNDPTGASISKSAEATATEGYSMNNLLTGRVDIVAKRNGRERRIPYTLHFGENHLDIDFPPGRATLECDVTLDHSAISSVDYQLTVNTGDTTEVIAEESYHLTPSGLQISDLPAGTGRLVVTLEHYVIQGIPPFVVDMVLTHGKTTFVQFPGPEYNAALLVDVVYGAGFKPSSFYLYVGAMLSDGESALTYDEFTQRRRQYESIGAVGGAGPGEGAVLFEALRPGTYTIVAFARPENEIAQRDGVSAKSGVRAQVVALEANMMGQVTLAF